MITSNDLMQNDSQYEALRAIHECVMNRLARIEKAVEALNLTDRHTLGDGGEWQAVERRVEVWRELRDAVN